MRFALAFILMLTCIPAIATQPNSHQQNYDAKRTEMNDIHRSVHLRFKPKQVRQEIEEFRYYGSNDSIRGDCDDFASAVYFELWKRGEKPTLYVYDSAKIPGFKPYRHVVVCTPLFCFDNNRDRVYSYEVLERQLSRRFELVIAGNLDESKLRELLVGEQQFASNKYETMGVASD